MLFDKQGRALTATPIDADVWRRLRALRQARGYKLVGMLNEALRDYLYRIDCGEARPMVAPQEFKRKPRRRAPVRIPRPRPGKSIFANLVDAG